MYTLSRYKPHVQQAPHYDQWSRVSIILSGSLAEETKHASIRSNPLDIVFKSHRVQHENRFGASGATVISMPFDLEELFMDGFRQTKLPFDWLWLQKKETLQHNVNLLDALAARDKTTSNNILTDILAETNETQAIKEAPKSLDKLRARIYDQPEENLDIADSARLLGMHPVYLARAYRKAFGVSPQEDRQLRRIKLASALLRDPSHTISTVAQDLGFYDQSHFCRVFKRYFRQSPNTFRSQMPQFAD